MPTIFKSHSQGLKKKKDNFDLTKCQVVLLETFPHDAWDGMLIYSMADKNQVPDQTEILYLSLTTGSSSMRPLQGNFPQVQSSRQNVPHTGPLSIRYLISPIISFKTKNLFTDIHIFLVPSLPGSLTSHLPKLTSR